MYGFIFSVRVEINIFCRKNKIKWKDLSQFQRKSAHAPQKELPKRKLEWKFLKITEMIISVFLYIE